MYLIESNRIFHHVYAILNDNNTVNDILYAQSQQAANDIAKSSFIYGRAFCIDNYPLKIGDFYSNRKFYRKIGDSNIEITPLTEEDDRISNLELIIDQKDTAIEYLEGKLNEAGIRY